MSSSVSWRTNSRNVGSGDWAWYQSPPPLYLSAAMRVVDDWAWAVGRPLRSRSVIPSKPAIQRCGACVIVKSSRCDTDIKRRGKQRLGSKV
jgi:hypothetical protein